MCVTTCGVGAGAFRILALILCLGATFLVVFAFGNLFSNLWVSGFFMEIYIFMLLVRSATCAVALRMLAPVLCSGIILLVVRAFKQKGFAALKGLRS